MDSILQLLFISWPYLHLLAAIALLIKAWFVFGNRGFDVPGFMLSFFRIYSRRDVQVQNKRKRAVYMQVNNLVNYYLYIWLFITATLLLISGGAHS